MFPELYPAGTSDFNAVGTPLFDAYAVAVKQRINVANSLTFNILRTSDQWDLIKNGAIIKVEEQLYVVKIITDGRNSGKPFAWVQAKHIWWEICEKKHLPQAFFIGVPVPVILDNIFSGIRYAGNNVARRVPLGLVEITRLADIEIDKSNPLDIFSVIINQVGGEIWVDNFNFALVEQLGKESGVSFAYGVNQRDIERTVEETKIVTRLFPYGRESLEIGSVNAGRSYIDSPYIDNYPYIYEGKIDFPYEVPEALLARALWEFSPDNFHRIDVPQVSYKMSVVDLWKLAVIDKENIYDYLPPGAQNHEFWAFMWSSNSNGAKFYGGTLIENNEWGWSILPYEEWTWHPIENNREWRFEKKEERWDMYINKNNNNLIATIDNYNVGAVKEFFGIFRVEYAPATIPPELINVFPDLPFEDWIFKQEGWRLVLWNGRITRVVQCSANSYEMYIAIGNIYQIRQFNNETWWQLEDYDERPLFSAIHSEYGSGASPIRSSANLTPETARYIADVLLEHEVVTP